MNTVIEFYLTIAQPANAEFKDRGSKFLAFAFPVSTIDECKSHISNLKKEHPKAVHHCFAFKLGLDGTVFRSNDDGEPSGSAGKPILGQIISKQLTDVLVVVVRYFGGTLLGVPGLINAYKTATALVLQTTPIIQKPIEICKEYEFDYTKMNDIMQIVKKYNCTIIKQEIQLFCLLTIGIPKARINEVQYKMEEIINQP
jgi:uncharacterized YigZ family protein